MFIRTTLRKCIPFIVYVRNIATFYEPLHILLSSVLICCMNIFHVILWAHVGLLKGLRHCFILIFMDSVLEAFCHVLSSLGKLIIIFIIAYCCFHIGLLYHRVLPFFFFARLLCGLGSYLPCDHELAISW